jgi:hypothetical protein
LGRLTTPGVRKEEMAKSELGSRHQLAGPAWQAARQAEESLRRGQAGLGRQVPAQLEVRAVARLLEGSTGLAQVAGNHGGRWLVEAKPAE